MPDPCSPRYAIYYTPAPEHPLTMAANSWLGRDAFTNGSRAVAADPVRGVLTTDPRRYGFHATLKAPFRLREGTSVHELERALQTFVAAQGPCPIGPLKIAMLDGFFALIPVVSSLAVRRFASLIVEEFDCFRVPMNRAEFQRRLRKPLDETETTYLVQWGYPYVFDRFRFHMTLTDHVPVENQARARDRLEAVFGPLLTEDFCIDALSLFVQEHSGTDFLVRSRFALRGRTTVREAV